MDIEKYMYIPARSLYQLVSTKFNDWYTVIEQSIIPNLATVEFVR